MALLRTASLQAAQHDRFALESVGVRYGIGITDSTKEFASAEAVISYTLPVDWDMGRNWHTWMRVDGVAGWVGDGEDAFTGSIDSAVILSKVPWPVTLEGGAGTTLLSRSEFETRDLGANLQFTLHAGINWDVTQKWRISYRFQHMSNGGFKAPNPGLNLHFLGVSYLFN